MGIVKSGLLGYWNYREGITNNSRWKNLHPSNFPYELYLNGVSPTKDGLNVDEVDDEIYCEMDEHHEKTEFTYEIIFKKNKIINPTIQLSFMIFGFFGIFYYDLSSYGMGDGLVIGQDTSSPIPIKIHPYKFQEKWYHITMCASQKNKTIRLYIDGVLEYSSNNFIMNIQPESRFQSKYFGGVLKVLRLYDRVLTEQEVNQNFLNGDAIGLEDTVPTAIPQPKSIKSSRDKLSQATNMNSASINFSFDNDVSEWVIRILGVSWDTGYLLGSGGAVKTGQEINVNLNWNQLQQEGVNKINVYGKNSKGEWTQYQLQ